MKNNTSQQKGFTLVELSIVLIIIGLIVGGVLAGQSLIASARLQSDITLFNQLDAGVNTFRLRYNGMPGDIPAATATGLGLGNFNPEGNENDGVIDAAASDWAVDGASASAQSVATRNLATAELISLVPFDPVESDNNLIGTGIIRGRTNGGIVLFGANGRNFVRFGAFSNAGADPLLLQSAANRSAFSPEQALFIDGKIDDGVATSGLVQSRSYGADAGSLNTVGNVGTDANVCNTAPGVYDIAQAGQNTTCGLAIRLSS